MILIVLFRVHPALLEDPYFGIQVPFAAVQFRTGLPMLAPGQEPGPAQRLMDLAECPLDPPVTELRWRDLWCVTVLLMHPQDHMTAIPEGLFLHPSDTRLTNRPRLLCHLEDSPHLSNSPTLCFLSPSLRWSLYSHGPIKCVPFPFNY